MSAVELEMVDALARSASQGVAIGRLVGFKDERSTPLVIYANQPGAAALPARAILDLHGAHIGCEVLLLFENADPLRPIIVGCIRASAGQSLGDRPGTVTVDADGERLLVTAKEQLVLRCGSASITLTKAGKVLISGAFVSNRSSGVMRIAGGSVQLN